MKKSFILLSALLATTTFIVNCQKAPDKRRVRPSGGAGILAANPAADEKLSSTSLCTKDISDLYRSFFKNQQELIKTTTQNEMSETEKLAYAELSQTLTAQCDELISRLNDKPNKSCSLDRKNQAAQLTVENMTNICNTLGKKSSEVLKTENKYSKAAAVQAKTEENLKSIEDYKSQTHEMTVAGLSLFSKTSTYGNKFLANGEIKSSESILNASMASNLTTCTVLGVGLDVNFSETAKFKVFGITKAEKSETDLVFENFEGSATSIALEVQQNKTNHPAVMLCLNMDSEKVTVKDLEKAFKEMKAEAAVSTQLAETADMTEATEQ